MGDAASINGFSSETQMVSQCEKLQKRLERKEETMYVMKLCSGFSAKNSERRAFSIQRKR